jgi:hypothetical protein
VPPDLGNATRTHERPERNHDFGKRGANRDERAVQREAHDVRGEHPVVVKRRSQCAIRNSYAQTLGPSSGNTLVQREDGVGSTF